jgi:hypothetical protein
MINVDSTHCTGWELHALSKQTDSTRDNNLQEGEQEATIDHDEVRPTIVPKNLNSNKTHFVRICTLETEQMGQWHVISWFQGHLVHFLFRRVEQLFCRSLLMHNVDTSPCYLPTLIAIPRQKNLLHLDSTRDNNLQEGEQEATIDHDEVRPTIVPKENDFVATVYDKNWYVGRVRDVDENEAMINCMCRAGKQLWTL